MKKALYIIIFCIIIFTGFLSYQKSSFNSSFQHVIEDKFISENYGSVLHFYFIQVSDYDETELNKIANSTLNSISSENSDNSSILICYFYIESEEKEMPEAQKKVIRKIYPSKQNLISKLSYYSNAYIYTASVNGRSIIFRGKKIASGKLVKSDIIIPKKGTNAYFILFGAD